MKIVIIHGSGRKNSFSSLAATFAASQFQGHDIKEYHLSQMNISGCRGCMACRKNEVCSIKDDMQELYQDVVTSDFVVFASPVYYFDTSSNFSTMFERLYPMIGGGPALQAADKQYVKRHPKKKCMLILASGAPRFVAGLAKKRMKRCLKMNGFQNMGIVNVDMTYFKKDFVLTSRLKRKKEKICHKVNS